VELNDVLRYAEEVALAIPRRFLESVNAGSIQNARREVIGADRRRAIRSTLDQTNQDVDIHPGG